MFKMNALELAAEIKKKNIGVVELTRACIESAENDKLGAYTALSKERASEQAARVQERINSGDFENSPLAGVPIAVKDNISTKGVKTTCASKTLVNYEPVYNASVIDRLEQAGIVVVGKLNMDEFAMGGSSETGVFGAVKNPWDLTRVPGGSSGGSAAAVAARMIPFALGSDTGGSIRQPCGFCGVTGIKPTYGAVSRYGLIAYASSLDQIGTIANNIDDCAALLSVISGADDKDGTCVIDKPFDFNKTADKPFKIGLPRNYFVSGIDEDVKTAVLAAAKEFENAGAVVEEFDMPLTEYMIHAYYIIACAEASSNLSRYDGLKYGYRSADAKSLREVYRMSRSEGFGLEVKRRIMLGSFVLSSGYYDAYYKKALQTRALIKNAYNDLFRRFDMVISPIAPTVAYKIGENSDDPIKMYMGDIYTVSINLAGIPAIALPCGFNADNMPIGFQLIGDSFAEEKLVAAARLFQERTDYHTKLPGGAS